jgi:hypothetical protein
MVRAAPPRYRNSLVFLRNLEMFHLEHLSGGVKSPGPASDADGQEPPCEKPSDSDSYSC